MKTSSFEIIRQGASGELQADLELEFDNSTGKKIHAIRYAVNFLDGGGFPLDTQDGWLERELDPGASSSEMMTATIAPLVPPIAADAVYARATATLFTRERIVLGEVKFPSTLAEPTTISKELPSAAIGSPLQAIAVRTDFDDGDACAECKVLVTNKSNLRLEVTLHIELFDADGDSFGSISEATAVPAMSTVSIECGSQCANKSQLKGATLRIAVTVFSPAATVYCESKAPSVRSADADDFEAEDSEAGAIDFDETDIEATDEGESEHTDADDEPDEEDDGDSSEQPELDPTVLHVLEAANATEFSDAFAENEITADVLASLSDSDLASMGVSALGTRKRILAAIAAVSSDPARSAPRPPAPPSAAATAGAQSARDLPRSARPATDWTLLTKEFAAHFKPFDRIEVAPDAAHKKLAGARAYATQLTGTSQVLAIYDETLFRSAKDGITVSDQGVHWRNPFAPAGFAPWTSFPVATAAGKSVVIQPGSTANTNYGGARCATVLAGFINSACGAFLASMPAGVHPQHGELRVQVAELLQGERSGSVLVKDPDSVGRVWFDRRGDMLVVSVLQHKPDAPGAYTEGCRVAGLIPQLDGYQEFKSKSGRDWYERLYAVSDLDVALQHAFLIVRALHLKPEGSAVSIEYRDTTGSASPPTTATTPAAASPRIGPQAAGANQSEVEAISTRVASAVNRDGALRPFFVLIGINADKVALRFSLHLSIDHAERQIKIRMRIEADGIPRYAGDTLEMINDKVMDDYLSAEIERLLPDEDGYSHDIGVEIGEVGFSKPKWKTAHED
jgi:hypothetical protein